MSFLDVKDRSVEFPNRIRLNNVSTDVYDVEPVTGEVIETGTRINRALLNILNSVLGFNEISGQYDSTNNRIDFELPDISLANVKNNQRLLVSPENFVIPPSKDFVELVTSRSTDIPTGDGTFKAQFQILDDGNIMVITQYSNTLTIVNLYDKNAKLLKSITNSSSGEIPVSYFRGTNSLKLSNGNVFISGRNNSELISFILNKEFNVTSYLYYNTGNNANYNTGTAGLIELDNGNILCVTHYYTTSSSYNYTYGTIYSQDGTMAQTPTRLSGANRFLNPQLTKLDDGTILLIGNKDLTNVINFGKLTSTGVYEGYKALSGAYFGSFKSIKLSNGNVMVVGTDGTDVYITIINPESTTTLETPVLSPTLIMSSCIEPQISKMKNGNIIIGAYNSSTLLAKFVILNESGEIIKSEFSPSTVAGFKNLYLKLMKTGEIVAIGCTSADAGKVMIINENGEVVLSPQDVGNYFANCAIEEIEKEKFMMVGHKSSSSYTAHVTLFNLTNLDCKTFINGKEVDSILEKDKFYELLYKDEKIKFLAQEVRK